MKPDSPKHGLSLAHAAAHQPAEVDREGLTPNQMAWIDRVLDLYEAAGIYGAKYSWHAVEGGVLVDYGDVEVVHSIDHPDIERIVVGMAASMQRGPLYVVPEPDDEPKEAS